MIFAFMSYKVQFVEKGVQLVEKALDSASSSCIWNVSRILR
jgi:hypothetical protein